MAAAIVQDVNGLGPVLGRGDRVDIRTASLVTVHVQAVLLALLPTAMMDPGIWTGKGPSSLPPLACPFSLLLALVALWGPGYNELQHML